MPHKIWMLQYTRDSSNLTTSVGSGFLVVIAFDLEAGCGIGGFPRVHD